VTSTHGTDPRLLGGRYRLDEKIGQGGMGLVLRATDVILSREVAIKLVPAETTQIDEELAARFLREAQNTARLQHENIVSVYDFGRAPDGSLYFVMELCRGETLSAVLRRRQRLRVQESVHVATQICAALAVAHDCGVVHRDLKPANVMLLPTGQDPLFVKVLDFGVAKSITPGSETALTRTGMIVGTVEYMAPEQIVGRPVDARTDVYALGVLLYRMLAGSPVFIEQGVPAIIHNHLNTEPEPIHRRAPEANVPQMLDRVVRKCLAKRPEGRYGSMLEVARALRSSLEVELDFLPSLEYDGGESWGKTEVARPAFDDIVDDDPEMHEETRVARRNAVTPKETPLPPAMKQRKNR
jgi:serine/threonine-protein kinase